VAVGWLVLEDLATVVLLVLLPLLATSGTDEPWIQPLWAVGKAMFFVVLMLTVGPRVLPPILARVVRTGSRELFILVALTAAVGTALAAASLFGVSLALGAFLAGVLLADSPFSHQVNAELLPFREAFAVLFFVSVGMLVNPFALLENWRLVLALTTLVVVGKALIGCRRRPQPDRRVLVHPGSRRPVGRAD
jgi:CPA2 family monovalent cation:H+ antiporter-2